MSLAVAWWLEHLASVQKGHGNNSCCGLPSFFDTLGLQRYILPRYVTYLATRATTQYAIRYITVRDKTSYQQVTLHSTQ